MSIIFLYQVKKKIVHLCFTYLWSLTIQVNIGGWEFLYLFLPVIILPVIKFNQAPAWC